MRPGRSIVIGFVLLAVAQSVYYFESSALSKGNLPFFSALSGLVWGVPLFLYCRLRHYRLPAGREWLALVLISASAGLLKLFQYPYNTWSPVLRMGGSTPYLIAVATPLWVALLAATGVIRIEVPRAVVAATIAGIGAVILVAPVEQPALREAGTILLFILCQLFGIYVLDYARRHLKGLAPAMAVTVALILHLILGSFFDVLKIYFAGYDDGPIEWRSVCLALLILGVVFVSYIWLWFWLLTRMSLPAFCMNSLAAWAVSAAVFLGIRNWRADLALIIAIAAITVALRARVSDEQPLALGLHST